MYIFLACCAVDIAGKNLYLLWDDTDTKWRVYFIMQSFSFLCYIGFIALLAYEFHCGLKTTISYAFHCSTIGWSVMALFDVIDEVFGIADKFQWSEWLLFLLIVVICIVRVKRYATVGKGMK